MLTFLNTIVFVHDYKKSNAFPCFKLNTNETQQSSCMWNDKKQGRKCKDQSHNLQNRQKKTGTRDNLMLLVLSDNLVHFSSYTKKY